LWKVPNLPLEVGEKKPITNESYGTLLETINGLQKEGYTMDFNIDEEQLEVHQADMILSPDDFEIDKVFRFKGKPNPADQ